MTVEDAAKKNRGAKLNRSETVTVRLDPKLRYFADLAARRQRRTLSSYIEWAIEESLKRETLVERYHDDGERELTTIADETAKLWDVDRPDRFAKLALNYPNMLTHEEQLLWKLIRENGRLWRGNFQNRVWTWKVKEENLVFEALREHWDKFEKVALRQAEASILPNWVKNEPGDMDDEIPF